MGTYGLCFSAIGILLFSTSLILTESRKLLVIPQDGSPWLAMSSVVEKLSQRGHQVVMVVPEVHIQMKKINNVTVRTFSVPYSKEFMESIVKKTGHDVFTFRPVLQDVMFMYDRIVNITSFVVGQCESLLQNDSLIKYLEDYKFDAMLNDPVYPCGEIIAEHLSIPSVSFIRGAFFGADLEASQSPTPASYVPRFFTMYTDHMEFSQRVKNFIISYVEQIVSRIFYAPYAHLASNYLQKEVTVMDLFSRASIWLLRYDFIFEFPRPVMPNMVFIGGINCVRRKPLTQHQNISTGKLQLWTFTARLLFGSSGMTMFLNFQDLFC
ncbi:UDP-glucuronosyltransferase 1A1-like [Pyxicephalus adspersus]|uniref:UDP-glucuronosyltransferase 1A1-like n=1 Tax=Pyxicephalus adspersus TaxID=30357 RepID=UPI003B59C3FD